MVGDIGDLIVDADSVLGAAEGGDVVCYSSWHLSLSASAEDLTPSILLARLSILTDIGMITIGTRAIDPAILSALDSMITSLISDMGYTVPPIGLKGDDE